MNGLPARFDDLDEREAAFVKAMAEGISPSAATAIAGYPEEHRKTQTFRLTRRPQVLAAIQHEIRRKLATAAPIAFKVALDLLQREEVSAKVRADIAFKLLERAGHVTPRAANAPNSDKIPLNEMPLDVLRAMRDRLTNELADRAKPLAAPAMAPDDSEAIDLLS